MLSLAQFTEHSLSSKESLEYVLLVFTAVYWLCYGTGRQNDSLFKSQKVKEVPIYSYKTHIWKWTTLV